MKLEIDNNALLHAIELVLPHKSKVVPVMGCTHVVAREDGTITFRGSDGITNALVTLTAVVTEAGEAAIPLELFASVVSGFPNGQITISASDDTATLKSGKFSARIKLMEADAYPTGETVKGDSLSIPYSVLLRALDGVTYAASDKVINYQSAVHMFIKDGRIMFEACDGARLARTFIGLEEDRPSSETLIAAASLDKAMRSIAKVAGVDEVEVTLSDKKILFVMDGTEVTLSISVTASADAYPILDSIIPISHLAYVDVMTADMQAALRVIQAVNRQNDILRVKLSLTGDSLTINTPQGQAGDANIAVDTVEGEGAGEISVNVGYLAHSIDRCASDKIRIHFNGPLAPLLFKGDQDALHILVPLN